MTKCERYQYGKSVLMALAVTGKWWHKLAANWLLEYMRKKYAEDCDTDIYHERHIKDPTMFAECCDDLK